MFSIRYKDKVKNIHIDRRTNMQQCLQQHFQIKPKIIGVVDSDGVFYEISQFPRQVSAHKQQDQFTIVTEELSKREEQQSRLQMSLKYSQISDSANRLTFIDFIYDLEEFQMILSGDIFTCIFLVDEKDHQGIDFLTALEPLVNNYNNWVQFYYTFHNRVNCNEINAKLLWVYRGAKKIVQLNLNNDKKMRQMDELMQKLVQTKVSSGNTRSSVVYTNPNSKYSSQVSPDIRGKRSKSIRRLVEEVQHSQTSFHPSRVVTRVQAKFTQRATTSQEQYQTEEQNQSNESIYNSQDQLFQLISDLEEKEILDISMSRLIKRLLIEENKDVIAILSDYLQNQFNLQVLCSKLQHIVDNSQQQQRPTSPFQRQQQPQQQLRQSQGSSQSQQSQSREEPSLDQMRELVFERNSQKFTPEQYGMAIELLKEGDQVLLQLVKETYMRMRKGDQNPNLMAMQVYTANKFSQLIQGNFTPVELSVIEEYRNKRTSGVYAVIQCFRYESNLDVLVESLKKALSTIMNMSISSSMNKPQQGMIAKQIQLFTAKPNGSPKAPSPISVLMPNFSLSVEGQAQLCGSPVQQNTTVAVQKIGGHIPNNIGIVAVSLSTGGGYNNNTNNNNVTNNNHQFTNNSIQLCHNNHNMIQVNSNNPQPNNNNEKKESQSPVQPISVPIKREIMKERTAREVIFDEETFMQCKIDRRQQNQINIDSFYSNQCESDLAVVFKDMMRAVELDDNKVNKAETLFMAYDNKLYDIIKNYQSFRAVSQTKNDLLKLLQNNAESTDYRKVKLFNLFINQVRQFTIQKHLQENEKNFLLKMFKDNDLQVLGTLETYLHNSNAQEMLENLQMIVKQYSKYINIHSQEQQYIIAQETATTQVPQLMAKDIIQQYRQYFTAEEKNKLEQVAVDPKDTRIELLHEQFQNDSDLNGFIAQMKALTAQDSGRRQASTLTQQYVENILTNLKKAGQLKIDTFLIEVIAKRRNESKIKGVFELFHFYRNSEELVENIEAIAATMRKELVLQTIDELGKEEHWPEQKIEGLKSKVNIGNAIIFGAFSVYFSSPAKEKEFQKSELIDTITRVT